MESTKSINVCYAKHISWALLGEDLFIFNEITDNTYLFRGLYKKFWLAIQNNNNLKNIIESISPKYNIDSSKIKKCMTRFIDNNLIVWSCV